MNSAEYEDLNRQMVRLADGDRSAFAPVFELVWPNVKRFAEKSLLNPADAEDAAQSALLKIFAQAPNYKKELDALPWILTIAAYECKTIRQKQKRNREDLGLDPTLFEQSGDLSPNAEDLLIEKDLKDAVKDIVARLNPREQETVMTMIEEREKPNIPAATFRKRLERALKKVEVLWKADYAS